MDRTDYQILNILQKDCRTTLKVIGDQVGLTAPAVSERIRRLEDRGVIEGFHIKVNREKLGLGVSGFILVSVVPERYQPFCQFCQSRPELDLHARIIGVYNALLHFSVPGTAQLEQLLTQIKQFGDSQTSVSLMTYFDRKAIPFPE